MERYILVLFEFNFRFRSWRCLSQHFKCCFEPMIYFLCFDKSSISVIFTSNEVKWSQTQNENHFICQILMRILTEVKMDFVGVWVSVRVLLSIFLSIQNAEQSKNRRIFIMEKSLCECECAHCEHILADGLVNTNIGWGTLHVFVIDRLWPLLWLVYTEFSQCP